MAILGPAGQPVAITAVLSMEVRPVRWGKLSRDWPFVQVILDLFGGFAQKLACDRQAFGEDFDI